MFIKLSTLESYTPVAKDGEIGRISDFLIDERDWSVRWLVINTGRWLPGKKVLVAPSAAERIDVKTENLPIDLSIQQIRESPWFDADAPVSRQREKQTLEYYGWPMYWGPIPTAEQLADDRHEGDPHLRSMRELRGYQVEAADRRLGTVDDIIIDEDVWRVQTFAVRQGRWFRKEIVTLDPKTIDEVRWRDRRILVDGASQPEQIRAALFAER